MEALSLEAGGAISTTGLKVDIERRGWLNICPLCVCVCARAHARISKDVIVWRARKEETMPWDQEEVA